MSADVPRKSATIGGIGIVSTVIVINLKIRCFLQFGSQCVYSYGEISHIIAVFGINTMVSHQLGITCIFYM